MPASQYRYVNYQKNCSYNAAKGLVSAVSFAYLPKNDPNVMI